MAGAQERIHGLRFRGRRAGLKKHGKRKWKCICSSLWSFLVPGYVLFVVVVLGTYFKPKIPLTRQTNSPSFRRGLCSAVIVINNLGVIFIAKLRRRQHPRLVPKLVLPCPVSYVAGSPTNPQADWQVDFGGMCGVPEWTTFLGHHVSQTVWLYSPNYPHIPLFTAIRWWSSGVFLTV